MAIRVPLKKVMTSSMTFAGPSKTFAFVAFCCPPKENCLDYEINWVYSFIVMVSIDFMSLSVCSGSKLKTLVFL